VRDRLSKVRYNQSLNREQYPILANFVVCLQEHRAPYTFSFTMGEISATWSQLYTSDELKRSSHILSAIDDNAYIFGGELLPRQPRDNHVYKIDIKAARMRFSSFYEMI
jgi:hypothetical protein